MSACSAGLTVDLREAEPGVMVLRKLLPGASGVCGALCWRANGRCGGDDGGSFAPRLVLPLALTPDDSPSTSTSCGPRLPVRPLAPLPSDAGSPAPGPLVPASPDRLKETADLAVAISGGTYPGHRGPPSCILKPFWFVNHINILMRPAGRAPQSPHTLVP